MKVPFVDLKAQYHRIQKEIDSAMSGVIESAQFIGGSYVDSFEKNFAEYVEAKHAIGVSSGTSALHLALKVLGIGPGDEVITASNTFIATTEAIALAGATPILVDAREDTLTIDPALIERAVTPRTKAIIPVHLFGQGADMDAVREIAGRHGLKIVADACQSHGARLNDSRKALLGDMSCFSFYPGKNLGAYGDGGMVVTDDAKLADMVRVLANHGRSEKYVHSVEGYNYRLDGLQAAILDVKLKHLDQWTEERRSRAALYDSLLAGTPFKPVKEGPGRYHVYHLYVVRTKDRDGMRAKLSKQGIATGIHYPIPLHLLKAYEHFGIPKGTFPVAERAAGEIMSLPMYPELTDEMVRAVVEAMKGA
jgi:dTDP-4-amino-4,6-dideoxygalactose transaminase